MRYLHNQTDQRFVRFIFDSVASIDTNSRPFTIRTEGGRTVLAESIIIATGRVRPIPAQTSQQCLIGNEVLFAGTITRYGQFWQRNVTIVGGSHLAVLEAINASKCAKSVTVICSRGKLTCSSSLKRRLLRCINVKVIFNSTVNTYITTTDSSGIHLHAIEVDTV